MEPQRAHPEGPRLLRTHVPSEKLLRSQNRRPGSGSDGPGGDSGGPGGGSGPPILLNLPGIKTALSRLTNFLQAKVLQESYNEPIFAKFKRLGSAHYYSYRAHLLRQASYDPELQSGKVWARSMGN